MKRKWEKLASEIGTREGRQPRVFTSFTSYQGSKIRCEVCPQNCRLEEGDIGICGGRQVIGGKLVAINYAQVSSLQLDPIEKKPLYHFYPGSDILSVGPNGCNLQCKWCQNWHISQSTSPTRTILPEELAQMADVTESIGVAFTYAEPLIWLEYAIDTGRVLHEKGLVNVFVTNGYINAEPFKEILQVADAFNIDLKSSDDLCYRRYCGGRLEDVQRTIRMAFEAGKHIEITHLVVTGINDTLDRIERIAKWVASVSPSVPLHLTRYFPAHLYNEPPTDPQFMVEAYKVAKGFLDWVYLGNLGGDIGQDSHCPNCGALLVKRRGYSVELIALNNKTCGKCGREIPFITSLP